LFGRFSCGLRWLTAVLNRPWPVARHPDRLGELLEGDDEVANARLSCRRSRESRAVDHLPSPMMRRRWDLFAGWEASEARAIKGPPCDRGVAPEIKTRVCDISCRLAGDRMIWPK